MTRPASSRASSRTASIAPRSWGPGRLALEQRTQLGSQAAVLLLPTRPPRRPPQLRVMLAEVTPQPGGGLPDEAAGQGAPGHLLLRAAQPANRSRQRPGVLDAGA